MNVANTGLIVDSRYLRSAGRNVAVPMRLQVKCEGMPLELVCTRVLRVLPAKRLVCSGEWKGQPVVVKFFLDSRRAKRHCAREERGLKALKDAGVKTPSLLFKGLLAPDSSPVLGLQRLAPAQDLSEAWEQAEVDEQRIGIMSRAIGVIADQHESGVKQDDLHCKNFLLVGDDVFSIDGGAVDVSKKGEPLSIGESLKNLALFFAQYYSEFDRLVPAVFEVYAEKRAWPMGEASCARLMEEVRRQRHGRKKDYLAKIYRECSAFVHRRSWRSFMVCDRQYYDDAMMSFLADPDSVMEAGSLLKDGNTSTVGLVEVAEQRLVVKRYNMKNAWHALKRCLRPSRAWISWRNAHLLASIGIRAPRPILFMEKRWGPFRSTAYFMTEYVGGFDAYHLMHSKEARAMSQERLANQFVELLQSFADASISHGDLKATNFILAQGALFVLDLDAMREHRNRWRFRRAFKRDYERFMENWAALPEVARAFQEQLAGLKL
ncbi:MAG: lipopolysaccharide kinase InaA family protein [Thermodesulfobacteriota bacterium]|nr:lipopolysaccharide kinase InaA family protein [Thermodesulfobacteriota bacterium]